MSMDKTAIERIEQLATSAHDISHQTEIPIVALPDGSKIHSLEDYLESPVRVRAKFKTERIDDFCKYVEMNADEGATVAVIDPTGGAATAIIDFGNNDNPGWKQHQASLNMKHTPEFAAVKTLCQSPRSQRELIEWLEDWSGSVSPRVGDAFISAERAIQAVRKVDLKTEGRTTSEERNYGATKGTMASIDAVSTDGDLPEILEMTCMVYPNTATRKIQVRLSLLTSGSEPRFKARLIGEDALQKNVAEEIEETIKGKLTKVERVYIGSIS